MANLSHTLQELGHFSEAEAIGREAMEGRQESLRPTYDLALQSIRLLASILCDQERSGCGQANGIRD